MSLDNFVVLSTDCTILVLPFSCGFYKCPHYVACIYNCSVLNSTYYTNFKKSSIPYFSNLQMLLSKENDLFQKSPKIFKFIKKSHKVIKVIRNPAAKCCQITKFYETAEPRKDFEKSKKLFFHKMFDKSRINAGKIKKPKMTKGHLS